MPRDTHLHQQHHTGPRTLGAAMRGVAVTLLGVSAWGYPAAWALLPLPLELRRVLVLQAAMPAAMFPVVMAKYYGGDPATAVRIVLATSLAALLTIPLWLGFGLALLR